MISSNGGILTTHVYGHAWREKYIFVTDLLAVPGIVNNPPFHRAATRKGISTRSARKDTLNNIQGRKVTTILQHYYWWH